jgi:hypothetical protein
MLKVFEKRRSVREFKEKGLSTSEIIKVNALIENLPSIAKEFDLKFKFIENGAEVFEKLDGLAGYNGKMIKAPHYLLICSQLGENGSKVAGYVGEWIILNLTKEDIATTWIDINNSELIKSQLCVDDTRHVRGLIALGHSKLEARVSNIYDQYVEKGYSEVEMEYKETPKSSRMSVEEFVYINNWDTKCDMETLKDRALDEVFYYMRLAPSWGNRQPWKFLVKNESIVLAIQNSNEVPKEMAVLESGIAMLYFEVAMHDIGISGKWDMNYTDETVPNDHIITGKYIY